MGEFPDGRGGGLENRILSQTYANMGIVMMNGAWAPNRLPSELLFPQDIDL